MNMEFKTTILKITARNGGVKMYLKIVFHQIEVKSNFTIQIKLKSS